jgi:hypothetical protein
LLQSPGEDVAKSQLSPAIAASGGGRIYQELCFCSRATPLAGKFGSTGVASPAAPPLRRWLHAPRSRSRRVLWSMRRCIVSNKLPDHLDRLHKVYSDAIATILLRKQNALHTIEPAVDAKAK